MIQNAEQRSRLGPSKAVVNDHVVNPSASRQRIQLNQRIERIHQEMKSGECSERIQIDVFLGRFGEDLRGKKASVCLAGERKITGRQPGFDSALSAS